jgi:transcriptional regulator GlxA family with amidase domain
MSERPLPSIAILALPEATASVIYGMLDLFCSAGRDWSLITHGEAGKPVLLAEVVAQGTAPLAVANGAMVRPDAALGDRRYDIVCVPELALHPEAELGPRFEPEISWLRQQHDAGAILATACSGAVLLAASGLLDGHDATTHWAYCDTLARRHPLVRVHRERALVASGEGDRLVMARQVDDPVIARCQQWLARRPDIEAPVASMQRLSGLAERTFMRRFRKAAGMSPIEYVHTLRLEQAKNLLETTQQTLEELAQRVGYEDATFFSRLFRRKVGLTPAQYRRRFGSLRNALSRR